MKLGDSHNGRYVLKVGNNIYKPRPLIWESLFLSRESNFRTRLDMIFKTNCSYSPFEIIPELQFEINEDFSGVVEEFLINPSFTSKHVNDHSIQIGMFIGLMTFFGVYDLNCENILVGIGKDDNKFYVAPIDIECIFNNLVLPSQTYLISKENCGLKKVFTKIEAKEDFLAKVIHGYNQSIEILNEFDLTVDMFWPFLISQVPIRIIFRETLEYNKISSSEVLCSTERYQILNGNVPYFFRYLNSQNVYFYSDNMAIQQVNSDSVLFRMNDVSRISIINISEKRNVERMRKLGSLELVKYLLKNMVPMELNISQWGETTISLQPNGLLQIINDGYFNVACN